MFLEVAGFFAPVAGVWFERLGIFLDGGRGVVSGSPRRKWVYMSLEGFSLVNETLKREA